MKLTRNKKGIGFLNRYIVALLVFFMIVSAFLLIPDSGDDVNGKSGFWGAYDYILPSNDLDSLDNTDNVSLSIRDVICDINPESNSCPNIDRTALGSSGVTSPEPNIIQGAYGPLVTVQKTLGLSKVTVENTGFIFGIDPTIIDYVVSIIFITVLMTIVLIIFNRSDV